jgi:CHAD domain-containing protein
MAGKQLPLPEQTVTSAVTRMAGKHLEAASRALARLEATGHPKGLHSFRVAIRRLRSLLRAYRPWLGRVAGRKVRHRLRELTRTTSVARDTDVQIDWLVESRSKLSGPERPGADWLLRKLQCRKQQSYRAAASDLRREFARAVKLIKKRIDDDRAADARRFSTAFLEVVEPAVAESRRRLAAITGADDRRSVHRARVQLKRLRYLVEPLRNLSAESREFLRQLKGLQRLLGELHDAHVLEGELAKAVEDAAREKARRMLHFAVDGKGKPRADARRRDESLGLVALAARARDSRDRLYKDLDRAWLAGRARPLLAGMDALGEALQEPTHPPQVKDSA